MERPVFMYGNISNTRINECFITYPNTEKWVEKMRSRQEFSTNFEVFGYLMKHSFECLILLLKALIIAGVPGEKP